MGTAATVRYSTPPYVFPIVILLAGGNGVLSLSRHGWATMLQGNFLIRSRDHFLANDLKVVLLDAPSNHSGSDGLNNQRLTDENAKLVGIVIKKLRSSFPGRPIWLVGTSTGTLSAVNAASKLTGAVRPDGIVLTSLITTTEPNFSLPVEHASVFKAELSMIHVPTYVVSHRQDSCPRSLGSAFGGHPEAILDALTGVASDKKELKEFDGGGNVGPACEAFAYHGFNGIEDDVVRNIAAFIKANTPELP